MENYRANAPVITFESEMKLHVGNHTFRMIHMPGHTPYQAAVIVEEEGVTFTSDNIFCKVQTWIQEGQPDDWLQISRSFARAALKTPSFPDTGRCATKTISRSKERLLKNGWNMSAARWGAA